VLYIDPSGHSFWGAVKGAVIGAVGGAIVGAVAGVIVGGLAGAIAGAIGGAVVGGIAGGVIGASMKPIGNGQTSSNSTPSTTPPSSSTKPPTSSTTTQPPAVTTQPATTSPPAKIPTTVSERGQNLIKNYDAIIGSGSEPGSSGSPHLEAYYDMYDVKTIGWGHTGEMIESNVPDNITYAEAERLFESDLKRMTDKANQITNDFSLKLTQQQYDASVMYAFQHGPNGTGSTSLTALMKHMSAGEDDSVRSILSGWGRRDDEWELYSTGDYIRNH